MPFQRYKYTDDDGLTHPIRLSTEVAEAQPVAASPGGPYDSLISADVGRSAREIGLKPREVLLRRTAGAAPNIKAYYNRMPVLLPSSVATLVANGTVEINGVTWNVEGTKGESQK